LKAAINTAAMAPVASCWLVATAAPVWEGEPVAALAEDEPELEADADAVEAAVAEDPEAEPLPLLVPAAVALRVPHFSLSLQVCWPSASLGWLLMHWPKVAWQM
jgi:hypothetical protein